LRRCRISGEVARAQKGWPLPCGPCVNPVEALQLTGPCYRSRGGLQACSSPRPRRRSRRGSCSLGLAPALPSGAAARHTDPCRCSRRARATVPLGAAVCGARADAPVEGCSSSDSRRCSIRTAARRARAALPARQQIAGTRRRSGWAQPCRLEPPNGLPEPPMARGGRENSNLDLPVARMEFGDAQEGACEGR
jgi:hypothetical protein